MIIGIVPGAMKPYHAGHHYLVEQAMRECDEVIIVTSKVDRNIISGQKMANAWQWVIIPLLPEKVTVKFAASPVGFVYDEMSARNEAGTGEEIRIYGGAAEIARFPESRISEKYPNITPINVAERNAAGYLRGVGKSPMAKGEWVRDAIINNDMEKFRGYLPKFLKPYASEYLDIIK